MVRSDGILKIIDLGFGKSIDNSQGFDKSITLNWWCDTPEEFRESKYDYQTEVYFVGKLFEGIIQEHEISDSSTLMCCAACVHLSEAIDPATFLRSRRTFAKSSFTRPSSTTQSYEPTVSSRLHFESGLPLTKPATRAELGEARRPDRDQSACHRNLTGRLAALAGRRTVSTMSPPPRSAAVDGPRPAWTPGTRNPR